MGQYLVFLIEPVSRCEPHKIQQVNAAIRIFDSNEHLIVWLSDTVTFINRYGMNQMKRKLNPCACMPGNGDAGIEKPQ